MTFATTPVDPAGIEQLADGLIGFSDEAEEKLQSSMMTTLFVTSPSQVSNGRCAYLIGEDGSRLWVPNSIKCYLVDITVATQTYTDFDPQDKLCVRITAIDGTSYILRCGLDSWAGNSFLTCLSHMSKLELAEQIKIVLSPKGRAVFISIHCINPDGSSFSRVIIPKAELGKRLTYDEKLSVISYANGTAQDNEDDPAIEAKVSQAIADAVETFEVSDNELDKLLDEVKGTPKKTSRKKANHLAVVPSN